MTTDQLIQDCQRTLELSAKATPGPWIHDPQTKDMASGIQADQRTIAIGGNRDAQNDFDFDLIASARTFAPIAAKWIVESVAREKRKDEALKVAMDALKRVEELGKSWEPGHRATCMQDEAIDAIKRITELLK